jgi:hypothetical protein
MLKSDISNSETSLLILAGSQLSAARQKKVAQEISNANSDDELDSIVLGPRQLNSIKMAAIKDYM